MIGKSYFKLHPSVCRDTPVDLLPEPDPKKEYNNFVNEIKEHLEKFKDPQISARYPLPYYTYIGGKYNALEDFLAKPEIFRQITPELLKLFFNNIEWLKAYDSQKSKAIWLHVFVQIEHPKIIPLLEQIFETYFPKTHEIWITYGDYVWLNFNRNFYAVEWLEQNQEYIIFSELVQNKNPDAIRLMKKLKHMHSFSLAPKLIHSHTKEAFEWIEEEQELYDEIIDNSSLIEHCCLNPFMYPLIDRWASKRDIKDIDDLNWGYLAREPEASELIDKYFMRLVVFNRAKQQEMIDNYGPIEDEEYFEEDVYDFFNDNWSDLSSNPSPVALRLLKENPEKIDWAMLSANPGALPLLKANPEKINWEYLCKNKNVDILDTFLKGKLDTLHKSFLPELLRNKSAFHITRVLQYDLMRENCKEFARELAEWVFHPTRILRLCDTYGLEFYEYMDLV